MKAEDVRFNRRLSLLVFTSFLFFATMVALRVGLGHTSYEATDSAGRPMGFNDPLGAEHYAIMLQNFAPAALLKPEYVYEWILLTMHAVGAFLLLWSKDTSARLTRWFFAVQALIFPFGLLTLPILPLIVFGFFTGGTDREGFVDIPFIIFTAHPFWLLTSGTIMILMKGPGLGMAQVWRGFKQIRASGFQAVSNAIR